MSDTDRPAGELSSWLHLAADNNARVVTRFRSFDALICTTANGNRGVFSSLPRNQSKSELITVDSIAFELISSSWKVKMIVRFLQRGLRFFTMISYLVWLIVRYHAGSKWNLRSIVICPLYKIKHLCIGKLFVYFLGRWGITLYYLMKIHYVNYN